MVANDGFGAQQDDARQDRDRRGEVPPPPDGAQPGEQQQVVDQQRERLLGGVTYNLMHEAPIPLLMAH